MKEILKKKRFYILLISIFFLLLLVILMLKNGVLSIDEISYSFIKKNLISEKITPYVIILTNLGGVFVLIIASLIMLLFVKDKKILIAIIVNPIISFLVNYGLKLLFRRIRPDNINWLVNVVGYSFPSGHAEVSMAYYGFLIYLIYTKFKSKKYKYLLISLLTCIILFIGISRIYLGVHYLSDVLAGYLVSIIYLVIFVYFYEKIIRV